MKLIRGSTCKSEINVHYVNQKYSFNSQLVNKVVNVNNVCNHTKTSRKENVTEKRRIWKHSISKKNKTKSTKQKKAKKKTLKNNNNKKKQKDKNNKHIYAYGHTRAPRHKYSNTSQEAHRRHY